MLISFTIPPYDTWQGMLALVGILLGTLLTAITLNRILFQLLAAVSRRYGTSFPILLVQRLRSPSRLLIPLLALMLILPTLHLSVAVFGISQHLITLVLIAAVAWALSEAILASRDYLLTRYGSNGRDDYKARAVQTQLTVAVRILVVTVLMVALAAMLMTFTTIRALGMSILASAGIIGVTAGFAAQRSIATLFAGLQIAITQPIRINDVVLVEGEYGNIEEITLTYVVVKIWDQRRLVFPVTYFLEKPFQNWTRRNSEILGTVYLYADYSIPVDAVRGRLHEILQKSDRWDGRVWGLQVTSASDRTVELRALMSAVDAPTTWDLRCEVREKLIDFMRRQFPDSLPRTRAELRAEEIAVRLVDRDEAGRPETEASG